VSDGKISGYRRIYGEAAAVGIPINCYLTLSGRFTIGELLDYFTEHHPQVDFRKVLLGVGGGANWIESATVEDVQKYDENRWKKAVDLEKWERKTLARLKAKYEGGSDD